jgi:HD-GYP domain-containing protein (c-di-GMP phosphodiesterase class II)
MSETRISKQKSAPDETENRIAELGRKFFHALFATLKTASIYEANNNRYISQANELKLLIAEVFTEDNTLSLAHKEGYFYFNNVRLTLEASDSEASEFYKNKFSALDIEGFTVYSRADSREIDKFIFAFSHFKPVDDPHESYQIFKFRLEELQIENIMPSKVTENKDPEAKKIEDETSKFKARKVFFQAISTVQDIMNQAASGHRINLAKTKRVVQNMVDQIIEDEAALMELTVLRNFDSYTYIHSVNVCVYSLILGHHLNLDKKRLTDLGAGALLHDIGKINLPAGLINKAESFNENDWEHIRMHPVYSVKAIIKTRGTDPASIRAIATAYEHHISYTKGGYPQLLQKRTPCLFAQIVAITDTFDAMISGRIYHKSKHTADQVITSMINRVGVDFNPLLLKVFINTIGIYPIGSVVTLSDDTLAIVSRTNPDDPEKPEVKVIADRTGPIQEVKMLDLSSEQASDIFIKNIISGEKYNIDPADFIDLGE